MKIVREESALRGLKNRVLQLLARIAPGSNARVWLHRARGVRIGKDVWIGYDVILETSRPDLIIIEDGTSISMRATIIAHFKEYKGVKIERDVFVGPGAIILPSVVVGQGAVIKAGSVVSQSVPPKTIVEGNPAVPVARCEVPLDWEVSFKEFSKGLRPLGSSVSSTNGLSEAHAYPKR
jgi:acetyltransferase-like isoleucine patch superfamily enzyme